MRSFIIAPTVAHAYVLVQGSVQRVHFDFVILMPHEVQADYNNYHAVHSDTTVARMLVGNKCDLEHIRAVSVEEGKSLAESEGLFFMETSALDSTNVRTAFEMVIREIYNNVSRKVLNSDSYKAELSVNRVSLSFPPLFPSSSSPNPPKSVGVGGCYTGSGASKVALSRAATGGAEGGGDIVFAFTVNP
ncbi:hypothetical protein RJ639_008866 [Escallonia herrerae]|uniref:Ras-related GTP-binding protein n=1 Tax=Escallonia herrerae TaxID=1293975 RepID=A0AA89AQF0_9ASTE|nr:hypothetical protein RJ639_008866 [Escallonia herrerae]